MKSFLLFLLSLLFVSSSFASGTPRKVLFIGIDGCRWDAVDSAATPAIHGLLSNAVYSTDGLCDYKTWSGNGWSSMLTGVWHTKHGVTDNSFSGANYGAFPDFLTRTESYNSARNTISIVHWSPINTTIIANADSELNVATDLEVKNAAVSALNTSNPDILFLDFDDVDHAGHTYGFSPAVPQYIASIELTDSYISEILTALHNRPDYASEDWLIVVTTDHGGLPTGHGGGSLTERNIFNIFSNPGLTTQRFSKSVISSSKTFREAYFPAGTYARPAVQAPFSFGGTQDFTIELWVKPDAFSNDPSFISNKNWNSGTNAGFVISGLGQSWKVNIGDGIDRLDIQGGNLAPGTWHHLAASFDRDGLMKVFEDGVIVGFDKMNAIGNINSTLPLIINQDGTTTYSRNFSGGYKDIRVWNAALPDSLILQWANRAVDATHPFYANLLVNYKLEDSTSAALIDASPNANNANVTGTVNWTASQTDVFKILDYSGTTREPDNAVTVLNWLCVPIEASWGLDGKSWLPACSSVSIQDINYAGELSIYPNPAKDQLYFNLHTQSAEGEMKIVNAIGEIVFEQSLNVENGNFKSSINVSNLSKGIYMLSVKTKEGMIQRKFVKE